MDHRLKGFFHELRRRKVWNVLAVFMTAALGLLSAAEYLFPALGMKSDANRDLAVGLLFAFPVVMVLGWVYDITARGLKRTQPLSEVALSGAAFAAPALPNSARNLHAQWREPARELLALPLPPSVPPDESRVARASLAQVRHELSTPINAMIGYAEILLEENSWQGHEELRDELTDIREASEQTLRRIDGALQPAILDDDDDENGAATLGALTSLPADLQPLIAAVQQRAHLLASRASTVGLSESRRDLDRIASAASQLHSMVEQLGSGASAAASRHIENASVVAREVLGNIRPVESAVLDIREGSLLIVEDNEINRDLLSRQLARQGYSVVSVGSGPEAFIKLATQEFDLILLDVLMAGMNGLEVLHRLKSNDVWSEIPVLMVSALDELDSVVRCIEMGADDYLIKPFDPVLLGARVRSNLRVRETRRLERSRAQQLRMTEALNTRLLNSLGPTVLASRLSAGEPVFEFAEQATALYAQFDGLANAGSAAAAALRVDQLNSLFSIFDSIADRLGISFTRPTDAPAWLALADVQEVGQNEAESLAALALEMVAETRRFAHNKGAPIHIRIGVHTGPALLGAMTDQRVYLHVGGEAVELAGQLAAYAQPDTVHISSAAYLRLRDHFHCESRGVTSMGSDLQMRTFVLGS